MRPKWHINFMLRFIFRFQLYALNEHELMVAEREIHITICKGVKKENEREERERERESREYEKDNVVA